jgi:adenylosuccinate synthase
LPQLRYTNLINGVTEICMTKIDVLNIFETISAATHYQMDGKTSENLPFDMGTTICMPVLKNYAGWKSSLDGVSTFEQLPTEARAFIADLEAYLGVPFSMISTGPERERLIVR